MNDLSKEMRKFVEEHRYAFNSHVYNKTIADWADRVEELEAQIQGMLYGDHDDPTVEST